VITADLRPGVVDVHAHWLPAALFGLPVGSPLGGLHDRDGELYLGSLPLSIATSAMSDEDAVLADMAASGVGVRALSAPPFAFPVNGPDPDYVRAYNEALAAFVARSDGALVGLGLVSLHDAEVARAELTALAAVEGIAGVAIPPLLAGTSLDVGVLRAIVDTAAALGLSVLVHPMQLPRPEWGSHYLANLIGNPTETATAVAAATLGGVVEALPDLRICFVHGGGCAPALLGRWGHGWRSRADVRAHSVKPPAETFASLFFDTVTHDPDTLRLLTTLASPDRVVCGSDYPFDMAEADPVGFAVTSGPDAATLSANGRGFLGLS
jgi:aminocarboxymuconate-semialdehyde decarboxylase